MGVKPLEQHANKENISTLSQNESYPVPAVVRSSKKNGKRRLRQPLRDITHLFNLPIQSSSVPPGSGFQAPSRVPDPTLLNLRKRKVVDTIDSFRQSNSKSLRKNFR
ncbi:hypothetical protein U1Q18_001684 [Sarracenia purpurea var. burkii]